jgi:predicted dithiol-disulfide oxidoreductase (DUF899 family)
MVEEMVLVPAADLAAKSTASFPNESAEYRRARTALLAAEIELRRHIERVAEQRRALPPGGKVPPGYVFTGEKGPVAFADLFAGRQTLVLYSMMYGPERARPCPMCTSMLEAWDGTARNVSQRVALGVVARSPIERLLAFKDERGWDHLQFYSDLEGDFTRAYVSAEDADVPATNVFTRHDGTIRHFWTSEMGPPTADPGQDPRGAPDGDPLWTILDLTPEGRGTDWYPKLEYAPAPLVSIT